MKADIYSQAVYHENRNLQSHHVLQIIHIKVVEKLDLKFVPFGLLIVAWTIAVFTLQFSEAR